MDYTMEQIGELIIKDCLTIKSIDPIEIFNTIAKKDYIKMHGPQHHILDGACILTAFYNAGGQIELENMLEKMMQEGLRMPAGACGLWGVCGAATSVGAAISLLDRTRDVPPAKLWGDRMKATSKAVYNMSEIGGPRCCKRNGWLSLTEAIKYVNENFDVELPLSEIKCTYSQVNPQCIGERCPYNAG